MGAALTTALLMAQPVMATGLDGNALRNEGTLKAEEFGKTRPPIGYVRFCATNPAECKPGSKKPVRVALDPARWGLLYQTNTFVNGKITPISDEELYGESERWAIPVDAGDCEDYVLLKQQYLEKLGFPASSLLITVVLDENNQGHAVLTVAAEDADYILDNRRNDILRWRDTKYTYLKRQSQQDPRQWVALVKERTENSAPVSASNRR